MILNRAIEANCKIGHSVPYGVAVRVLVKSMAWQDKSQGGLQPVSGWWRGENLSGCFEVVL